MKDFKQRAAIAAAVALTVALMAVALRNVKLGEAVRAAKAANLLWIIPMLAVMAADLLIRALRWRMLLAAVAPRARVWPLYRFEAIGLALNNVFFLRIGEVARAFAAGRGMGVPVVTVLASIVVERFLDLGALLLLFGAVGRSHPPVVAESLPSLGLAGAAAIAFFLAVLPAVERFLPPGETGGGTGAPAVEKPGVRERLLDFLRQAARGTRALRDPKTAVACAALSLALWLTDTFLFWSAGRAFGIAALAYGRSLLVLATAAAASFLPAVPGSFGAYELLVKEVVLRVDPALGPDSAFAYAVFLHVVNYLAVTAFGLVLLAREGLSLASLKGTEAAAAGALERGPAAP